MTKRNRPNSNVTILPSPVEQTAQETIAVDGNPPPRENFLSPPAFYNSGNLFKKILSFLLIWLISCGIGIAFRLYPLLNNASHDATEKATMLVISNLRKTVAATVERQNPQLSKTKKDLLAKEQFDRVLHTDSAKVQRLVPEIARRIDAASLTAEKPPYLLESDSFLYFGLTENIIRTGKMSDTIKGSKYLHKLMLAPVGHWEPFNLHPYVGFIVYKIMAFFDPDVWPMYAVSFTPLVVTCFAIFAFLAACWVLRCSPAASLVGAINLVLASIFLKRSMFGWYDNDPYNIFFPFAILAVLFYGLQYTASVKKLFLIGGLCSLLIAGYALFWQGWVFLESILVLSGILTILYTLFFLKEKETAKRLTVYFSVVTIGSFAGIGAIFGFKEFFVLFQEGWIALQNFLNPQLSIWPDLYIGVGELKKSSLPYIIHLTGGYPVFVIAVLAAIFYSVQLFYSLRGKPVVPCITLIIFLIFAIKMTLGAERFAILCLIPLNLFFTLGVNVIMEFLNKNFPLQLHFVPGKNKVDSANNSPFRFRPSLSLCLAVCVLAVPPIFMAKQETPGLLNQIFNDVWDRALTKIRTATSPESIVNTWWPPGHFIKTIAQRRVTFDGASINNPQGYWLADVFLADDENRALGLLRMLNNSANQAAEYLIGQGLKVSEAVDLLKAITPLNAQLANNKLKSRLSDDQIQKLLALTHADPPPSYLLIYNDLIEKNLQISFVGNWNFRRIEEVNSAPALQQSIAKLEFPKYIQFLWKMAGGAPKYSDMLGPISQTGNKILFQHNVEIDLDSKECTIRSPQFGQGIPQSVIYQDGERMIEKEFPQAKLPYSVLLFKRLGYYNCILLDTHLAKSMMMRLYFLEGKGLKYFEPFGHEIDTTGRTEIFVYRINWEEFLKSSDGNKLL